jgi:hypothetical protein
MSIDSDPDCSQTKTTNPKNVVINLFTLIFCKRMRTGFSRISTDEKNYN